MRDYISIGSTPHGEPCIQIGHPDYQHLSMLECKTYIEQLRRVYGYEPEGCSLRTKSNPHDFGTYYEVVCFYNDNSPESSIDFAFSLEEGCEKWDEESREALENENYPFEDAK